MLLATAYATKSAQICPKAISLRNFEIPPKIEILISSKKKETLQHIKEGPKYVLSIWIFNTTIFYMSFLLSKIAFICKFQHIPLLKIIFFSTLHTPFWYEILLNVPNSARNKNIKSQNPYLLQIIVS
jgi:hypothetical protein